jgi:hypothetical protein
MLPIVPWRTLRVQPLALNCIHLMCMLVAPGPNFFGNVSTAVQKQATIVKHCPKLDMNCGREASVSHVNVFLRKTGSPVNALPYVLNAKTSMVRAAFAEGSPAVLLHPSRLAVFGEAVDESDSDSTFPKGRAVASQKESVCLQACKHPRWRSKRMRASNRQTGLLQGGGSRLKHGRTQTGDSRLKQTSETRSNVDWGQPHEEWSSANWRQQYNSWSNPSAVAEHDNQRW